MQQRLFLMPFIVLLSCIAVLFAMICCSHLRPTIAVGVSDVPSGGIQVYSPITKSTTFVPYAQSDKFVCFTPADAQALFDFCAVQAAGN